MIGDHGSAGISATPGPYSIRRPGEPHCRGMTEMNLFVQKHHDSDQMIGAVHEPAEYESDFQQ
jgi:hypothetical protein